MGSVLAVISIGCENVKEKSAETGCVMEDVKRERPNVKS
jgi:hypothetical protein